MIPFNCPNDPNRMLVLGGLFLRWIKPSSHSLVSWITSWVKRSIYFVNVNRSNIANKTFYPIDKTQWPLSVIKFHLIFCWIPTSFPDWYGRWQGPWLLRPFSTIRETADLNTSRFGIHAKSVLNEGYNPTRTGMQASRDNCQLCSENRQVLEYFEPG